jgi:hypothetical protein
MTDLLIRIEKKPDGSAVLSCRRADGSVTWQRQQGRHALFFPLHDLTHYAVETVLEYGHGFWGLLALGWGLDDFGKPWPRGPLPLEASISEFTVGFFDQERAAGTVWTAQDFNTSAVTYLAAHGPAAPPKVSDAQLNRIRDRRRDLFARWQAVPAGQALELEFTRTGTPTLHSPGLTR